MNLTYRKKEISEGVIQVELEGKILSTLDVEELKDKVLNHIAENNIHFIFDFSKMDYMNSTGLNFVITIFTKARNAGGELIISSLNETIKDLLVITKLDTIITSFENTKEAQQHFEKQTINN